jgi:hypothetical protein
VKRGRRVYKQGEMLRFPSLCSGQALNRTDFFRGFKSFQYQKNPPGAWLGGFFSIQPRLKSYLNK